MDWHTKVSFPGESAAYRAAREDLLAAERDLRTKVEEVAQLRRRLPLGGEVREDYVFEAGLKSPAGTLKGGPLPVKLSELFRDGIDTLGIYSFMYGPAMERPCPMCSSFLDSLNGTAPHAGQRMNLAVAAKSPIERIREFADARGWHNPRMLSSAGNTYNRDYHAETADGGQQLPVFNVFVRREGKIYHSYNTEPAFETAEPGQNERHIDMMWPLWNLLDLTPEGRGGSWYPRLGYQAGCTAI